MERSTNDEWMIDGRRERNEGGIDEREEGRKEVH